MNETNKTIRRYDAATAARYDEESSIIRADRTSQWNCLLDILNGLAGHSPTDSFVDLGCGTAYFTEVFFDVVPNNEPPPRPMRQSKQIAAISFDGNATLCYFDEVMRHWARP